MLDDLLELEFAVIFAEGELGQCSVRRRCVHSAPLKSNLASPNLCRGHLVLGGRSREALHATVLLQLRHFLRHVLLVLDQNVLVLDIQLA